ncbi:kelch-like protein 17 [Rhipicephalus microplus]|uniref:kelch-like protein 17 n=1 Tax=Rhipicephalus microplus TaxID=6941 RepID=UPI003F6C0AD2
MSAVFWGDQSQQELEGLTHDCVIRTANGGEFRVHRGFLGASSPVLQALFSVNQGGRCDVLLQDVSASAMDALLGYCYSNKLCLNENNVTEILATADMLLMDEARNQCLHYLLRNLRIENCLGIASLVQWYHCPNFSKAVLSYVREHFDQVWRTSDEFPVVTESLLVELLSSNELNVHDEVDLLHAIVRWSSARNAFAGGSGATMSRLLQSFRVGLCDSL